MRKRFVCLLLVCALSAMLSTTAFAVVRPSIMMDVFASSAPNAYGSPSWSGYCANALNGLENGLSSVGDRASDPKGYERAPALVLPGEIEVTTFNSWRGQANPTGAFAAELGNRMHFGLHAYGDGYTQFKLNDLTFALHSSDVGDSLVYTGDFIGYGYNGTTRYGINWGADRVKGGGDDTIYTSGNGTTLVDELVYVGVGNAWWPGGDATDPGNPPGGGQAALDASFASLLADGPITVTCSYSLPGASGSDSVQVVPEPAALTLLVVAGLAMLGYMRIRRQS
jgi:hypothetical protein